MVSSRCMTFVRKHTKMHKYDDFTIVLLRVLSRVKNGYRITKTIENGLAGVIRAAGSSLRILRVVALS